MSLQSRSSYLFSSSTLMSSVSLFLPAKTPSKFFPRARTFARPPPPVLTLCASPSFFAANDGGRKKHLRPDRLPSSSDDEHGSGMRRRRDGRVDAGSGCVRNMRPSARCRRVCGDTSRTWRRNDGAAPDDPAAISAARASLAKYAAIPCALTSSQKSAGSRWLLPLPSASRKCRRPLPELPRDEDVDDGIISI